MWSPSDANSDDLAADPPTCAGDDGNLAQIQCFGVTTGVIAS
jgi:hypothetical protein